MTFSDNYLKHLEVLQNVGMTRIDEVDYNGQKIVPLQFLKAVLPDPGSLGPLTKGRTCIGVVSKGIKDGRKHQVYIYNICDHEQCFAEVGSQAISYTTGVPAMIGAKVNSQIKNIGEPKTNNPLGRVLMVTKDNPTADIETVELKLGEAILRETPKFNSMLPLLKIISVVAPLLGLLGTVTGMIVTFQAITLYGAGDPKLMAGGISTALVTTVLGLCVAIPTVFLHTLVQSRARRLTQILQEEAAGMLSERAEKMG